MFIDDVSHQSATETISNDAPYCTFHQFLSLTSNGFVLEIDNGLIEAVNHDIGTTVVIELSSTLLLFDILNKGSPVLV
jgi:hypothetical protein